MSAGLVAYGSSDDEDEAHETSDALPTAPDVLGSATTNSLNGDHQLSPASRQPAAEQGPVVGPQRPSDSNGIADETEDQELDLSALSSMSDHEVVRFLTQPTHPVSALPDSPPGSPDTFSNAKFERFLELKKKGVHFNQDLASKTSFKNPNLLSTLMERAGITGESQYRNSLPSSVFDLANFPAYAFKAELLRSQQTIDDAIKATKKSQSAAGKRTIDFTSAGLEGEATHQTTTEPHSKRKRA